MIPTFSKLGTTLFVVFLFAGLGMGIQAAETTYVGTLSGVECTACKKTIAKSLGKLKGVQTIRIIKAGDERHRIEVITDGSNGLSKADATQALKKAEHYKILTWTKK